MYLLHIDHMHNRLHLTLSGTFDERQAEKLRDELVVRINELLKVAAKIAQKMDGLDACRRIRALEAAGDQSRTPIIALTASVLPENRECCLSAGMDGFVSKPIDISVLKAALEKVVAEQ